MSRRQKTDSQRETDGSRKRPHHHAQPTPPPGEPTRPAYLTGMAAEQWDVLAGLLRGEQRLTLSAAPWLELTARAYVYWRESDSLATLEAYRKALGEGGLTPSSVSRVKMPERAPEVEVSPFAQLQAQIRRVK